MDGPGLAREQRLALLERARSISATEPDKYWGILHLANCYRRLGDPDAASDVLNEVERELFRTDAPADELYGYFRGSFAVERARLTGEDTTALLAGAEKDYEHNRYRGAIAVAIASRDAARAEELLNNMRGRHDWTARICGAIAAVDPQRAERAAIAAAEPTHRAYALALVARAIGPKDPPAALRLIEQAYEILDEAAEANRPSRTVQEPVPTGMAILEVVEEIDPTLVRESMWRAISYRHSGSFGTASLGSGRDNSCDPMLAACVSRYDRDLASFLLQPLGYSPHRPGAEFSYYQFMAAGILNPEQAIEDAASLPFEDEDQQLLSDRAWRELFVALMRNADERWEHLRDNQMHLTHSTEEF